MYNMNLFNLQCFVTLAQMLNYTKAAEELGISQPALSKMMRALEDELGFRLFIRDTRTVKLTEAGSVFYYRVQHCLNDVDYAVSDTKKLAKGMKGSLRIGVLPYAFSCRFPEIIQAYRKQYPEVLLTIVDGEAHELEQRLLHGELDVAMMPDWGIHLPENYDTICLYQDEYCAVVSKDHPLAQKDEISLEELKSHQLLLLQQRMDSAGNPDYNNNRVREYLIDHGMYRQVANARQIHTLIGLCLLAGCNEGVAILASHMNKFTEEDYYLKFVYFTDVDLEFRALACYNRKTQNPCAKEFVNVAKTFI